MENQKDQDTNLVGPKSILNVDAQKEVITHTFSEMRKNFLILFPLLMLTILGVVLAVFYFVGILKFK